MAIITRALSQNGGIVICAIDSTDIVRKMESLHTTSATATAALGRVLTAASLMGIWLKNEQDSLTLRVSGGGAVGTLLAVSDGRGNVRGYCDNPLADAPTRPDGKLDVAAIVGQDGLLSVAKDIGLKEPYTGQVPLVTGEIAEDITAYYAASEQTPTVCALGVLVNPDLSVRRAGGFLLQLLPGATEEEIAHIEKNIAALPAITSLLESGLNTQGIAERVLSGFSPGILDEREVSYHCYCSTEKVERILISLGRSELEQLRTESPVAEVSCHFCNKKYEVSISQLLADL